MATSSFTTVFKMPKKALREIAKSIDKPVVRFKLSEKDKEALKKEYMNRGATEEQAEEYVSATQSQIFICCRKGKYATIYTPKSSSGAVPGIGPVQEGENLDKKVGIVHCKNEDGSSLDAKYIGTRNGDIGYWGTGNQFIPVTP
jgi:hypothetical protein